MKQSSQVAALAERGVKFLAPETVFVAPDVNPERIAPGVVIHPGCRLAGAALAIGPDCVLGEEGPVTIRDCQIGAGVRLRGGAFERATMRDGVEVLFRPARFGRARNKQDHSGWECWKESGSQAATSSVSVTPLR